jgi:uncharacterized protein
VIKRNWRRWFRAFHRDIGYVAVALILAYSISGLAVNHIESWNPSYKFDDRQVDIGPLSGSLNEKAGQIVERLSLDPGHVRGHFQENDRELRVFLDEGQEARIDMETGRGRVKTLSRRAVLFEVNALHLNNLKGVWTYIADAFAIALIVLALTGMTMMKGDRGLFGRGKYFVAAGLAIPVGFIVYIYT